MPFESTSATSQREERQVEFYRHSLGDDEKRQVCAALDGAILTTGSIVAEAEQALADYLGIEHVVCLSSCTAALHLALAAHDIGPGDEVVVPAMTFVATANAVVMSGATPIFADVDPKTGCLTAKEVARAATTRTRAVVPVHLHGLLCDMDALEAIADDRGLILVEDCAHCLEAERGKIRPGSHAAAACFSFYATKALTCGEGGALATHSAAVARRARRLARHGMSTSAFDRYGKRYESWEMEEFGFKYNLDNIRASLLLPQIAKLDSNCQKRRRIAARYERAFATVEGVEFPQVAEEQDSARHLFAIWVDAERRDDILHGLQRRGVGATVNYRPAHLTAYYGRRFGYRPGDLPVAESIGARAISLPLHTHLTDEDVDYVIGVVTDTVAGRHKPPTRGDVARARSSQCANPVAS